jgi:hypothetical protein
MTCMSCHNTYIARPWEQQRKCAYYWCRGVAKPLDQVAADAAYLLGGVTAVRALVWGDE